MTWADYKVLLNKTGWNATAVGKSLGISSSVMSQRLTALGIDFRKEKAEHFEKVRHVRRDLFRKEFVNSGYSFQLLGKKFGMRPDVVRTRANFFGFHRDPESALAYAVKVDDSSIERLKSYLKTIQETTGVELSLHEVMRAAIYEFARKPVKRVYKDTLNARGRSWRLARRPQGDEKK